MERLRVKPPRFLDFYHVLDRHSFRTGGRNFCRCVFPFLNPRRQTLDFLLLRLIIFFLLDLRFFFLFHKCRIISRIPFDVTVFDFIRHINHAVQKHAVM